MNSFWRLRVGNNQLKMLKRLFLNKFTSVTENWAVPWWARCWCMLQRQGENKGGEEMIKGPLDNFMWGKQTAIKTTFYTQRECKCWRIMPIATCISKRDSNYRAPTMVACFYSRLSVKASRKIIGVRRVPGVNLVGRGHRPAADHTA